MAKREAPMLQLSADFVAVFKYSRRLCAYLAICSVLRCLSEYTRFGIKWK